MSRTSLAIIFTLSLATPAAARIVSFTFDGPFGSGSISGSAVLDVEGGIAASGHVAMSGFGISGTQVLYLVTPAGAVYRSGNGTDLFGGDNRYPITWDGIVFGTNARTSWVGGYNFGIWANAPGVYQGFASGPGLWSYTGQLTVDAAPEPATWALVTLGLLSLGIAGHRRQRAALSIVEDR